MIFPPGPTYTPHYYIGVDIGYVRDYTAIVVLERALVPLGGPDYWEVLNSRRDIGYSIRHIERFHCGLDSQLLKHRLSKLLATPPFPGASTVIADATGSGLALVHQLRRELRERLIPVIITSGHAESGDDAGRRVPKRDLIAGIEIVLRAGKLKIAAKHPLAALLIEELRNMRLRHTPAGNDQYTPEKSTAHDDLVIALALAVWWARKRG